MPAPFGPTRPIRSPRAIAPSTWSRMTKVPISRTTPASRTIDIRPRRRRAGAAGRCARAAAPDRARGLRRVAAARRVRSVRARRSAAACSSAGRQPDGAFAVELASSGARVAAAIALRREDLRRRPSGRPPRAAGTTSRNASSACRGRSGGAAARSAGTPRRRAGRPAAAPASSRRRRAPCSRRSRSRGTRPPPRAPSGSPRRAASGRRGRSEAADRSGWSRARQSASSA